MKSRATVFDKVDTSNHYENTKRDLSALNSVLSDCGLSVTGYTVGVSIVQYRVKLPLTVNVNKVMRLAPNISIALRDDSVKVYRNADQLVIEKPIEGRRISILELYNEKFEKASGIPIMLGKDAQGNNLYTDLEKAPHMLVAGMTGSGKSAFMHTVIISILAKNPDAEIIMVDPKMSEYQDYNKFSRTFHLYTDNNEALEALRQVCIEMDNRYNEFTRHGFKDYADARENGYKINPLIVMIDEYADLMSATKSKCDQYCVRIAQKARAAGIHLIIATQYPLVKYVSGGIKANIPVRVSFRVQNGTESRVIIDRMGAEKLNGKGDMLFVGNGAYEALRIKTPYATKLEIHVFNVAGARDESEAGIERIKTDWRSPATIKQIKVNAAQPETDGFDFTKTKRYEYMMREKAEQERETKKYSTVTRHYFKNLFRG